jgi:hypothetical protein
MNDEIASKARWQALRLQFPSGPLKTREGENGFTLSPEIRT